MKKTEIKKTRIVFAKNPERFYIFPKRRNWLQKLILRWLTGCKIDDYTLEIVVGGNEKQSYNWLGDND